MIKHWTPEEERILIERKSAKIPLRKIAEELGRTIESVKTRSKRIGSRDGSNKGKGGNFSWEATEIAQLYSDLDYDELAVILDRTRRSIEAKCQKLGISKRFPGQLICGNMCPTKSTILYLVDFGEFKKVGVTQQSVQDRFRQDKNWKLLDSVELDLPAALETEAEILHNVRNCRVYGDIHRGGTECFVHSGTVLSDFI